MTEPLLSPSGPGALPRWYERAALHVMQAGAVLVVVLAASPLAFDLDRFYLPKEAVLHATAFVAGALLLPALRRLSFTRADALLAAFALASGLSGLLATNGWNAARALAMTGSGLLLYACARALGNAGLTRPLLGGLVAAVVVASLTALAQAYGLDVAWFSQNRVPGGTLGNRNSIGHLVALGSPLLLLAAFDARSGRRFALSALGLLVCVAVLILTRSRAAWLAFACVLLVMGAGVLFVTFRHRVRRLPARLLLLVGLMATGVGAALLLPNTLNWRSDAPYLETARSLTNHREGSGAGRLVQYRQSLRMVLHQPIFGVGPGNWPVEYPGHAARRDPSMSASRPGMTMNPWPSSDLVALVAERGALGFSALALAAFLMIVTTLRGVVRATTPEGSLGALALLAVWLGTAVAGAFDAVLLLAWPLLVVATATGALWAAEATRRVPLPASVQAALLALLVLASGVAGVHAVRQVRAMTTFAQASTRADLERAARLDPGNFRIRLRLAQSGRRAERCEHALVAHDLFPHSRQAARAAQRCR